MSWLLCQLKFFAVSFVAMLYWIVFSPLAMIHTARRERNCSAHITLLALVLLNRVHLYRSSVHRIPSFPCCTAPYWFLLIELFVRSQCNFKQTHGELVNPMPTHTNKRALTLYHRVTLRGFDDGSQWEQQLQRHFNAVYFRWFTIAVISGR